MKITATSEKAPNEILRQTTPYGSYWAAIRLVGWISQNKTNTETTLYFKWQVGADNYWPYWNVTHQYTVKLGSTTVTDSFTLPQAKNSWVDVSSKKSIKVKHDSNGSYSGSLTVGGYKYFEAFSQEVAVQFPDISEPSQADSEAETKGNEPAEITNDEYDSRFFILSDGEIVYSPNDDEHIVTNPSLSISVNETDSLSFTMPPTNVMYDAIDKLRSTIEVRQGTDILFRGRVVDDTTDFNNIKSVNCEGIKAFFNDTVMPPFLKGTYKTAKAFFKAIIDQHNSQAKDNRKIVYVDCDITEDIEVESDEYQQCSDAFGQLLDAVDGYFVIDYYEDGTNGLSFLSSYGYESSQQIEFGKNLLDVAVTVDATSIYTSVLPLGAKYNTYVLTTDRTMDKTKTYFVKKSEVQDGQTVEYYSQVSDDKFVSGTTYYELGLSYRLRIGNDQASNYGYIEDQSAIEKFGRIIKVVTYDDIVDTDPETGDPINYVDQLKELGETELQAGLGADVTISGKLIDFHIIDPENEKLRVGDSVKIISTPHNLDGYYMLSACTLQLQNPDQSDYTFGASIRALTDS